MVGTRCSYGQINVAPCKCAPTRNTRRDAQLLLFGRSAQLSLLTQPTFDPLALMTLTASREHCRNRRPIALVRAAADALSRTRRSTRRRTAAVIWMQAVETQHQEDHEESGGPTLNDATDATRGQRLSADAVDPAPRGSSAAERGAGRGITAARRIERAIAVAVVRRVERASARRAIKRGARVGGARVATWPRAQRSITLA